MTESASTPADNAVGQPAANSSPPAERPAFKDRKIGLIVFGIIQLLMAVCCLGLAGLQIVMIFAADALDAGGMGTPGLFAVTAIVYALLAAGMAWLGIGSIQCRRWARALTLVLAWLGLATGLLATVLMLSIFQSMISEIKAQAPPGAEAGIAFAMGCSFLVVALIYIILPGAFVLFYRSPHVKATCEHYDAQPRWTDRLPLPVLAGGVLLVSMTAYFLAPLMGTPVPFFGEFLFGAPAWLYSVAVGGLAAYLARGFFRREYRAWLGALLFMAFNWVNTWISFRGDGLMQMYEGMNIPTEQLDEMKAMGIMTSIPWVMLVSTVLIVGFYLWLGRYFDASRTE